jgi:type VI secretion system protein ImpC
MSGKAQQPAQTAQKTTEVTVQALVEQGDPEVIISEILNKLGISNAQDRSELSTVLSLLLRQAQGKGAVNVDKALGLFISMLQERLGAQMNEVLHHPTFQAFEGRWRGLEHIVKNSDGSTEVSVLSATLDEIAEDVEQADLPEQSAYYRTHLYQNGLGSPGATPPIAVLMGYSVTPTAANATLFGKLAGYSARLHAPLFANVSPKSFNEEWADFGEFPSLMPEQIKERFDEGNVPEWEAMRGGENARYLGFGLPGTVGRLAYHKDQNPGGRGFKNYTEAIEGRQDYLFIPATYSLGKLMLASFQKTGLPNNIAGPESGGSIEGLSAPEFQAFPGFMGGKFPTEAAIDYAQEKTLSEDLGFIPIMGRVNSTEAFVSALPSAKKRVDYGPANAQKSKQQARGTLLDNMLLVSRLAQVVVMMQRRMLGARLNGKTIRDKLQEFLSDYKYPPQPLEPQLAMKYPLKSFEVIVHDDPAAPGKYKIGVKLEPIDTFLGATVAFSLDGEDDGAGGASE